MKAKQKEILIVDDTPNNLRLLSSILTEQGHKVRLSPNGFLALTSVRKKAPDLILLDVLMPEINGYEVCKQLKAEDQYKDIPILFISALQEAFDKTLAFQAGGLDYITKPFNENEVVARVNAHLELKSSRDDLLSTTKDLELTNAKLIQAQEELIQLASTDPLTGLYNRRRSMEYIEDQKIYYMRNKRVFAFVIADIDDFKLINDTYGHQCGDFILKEISRELKGLLRHQDILGRWGGEEFNILLPETDKPGAKVIIEKLRSHISDQKYIYRDETIHVSMTFGISEYSSPDLSVDELIRHADIALYDGKNSGKNCIIVYSD
jgi:diguanylate cyclase (GGDEF)-like protein